MRGYGISRALIGAGLAVLPSSVFALDKTPEPKPAVAEAIDGAELFGREWLPDDPRSHGGDGLGPLFNDSSCVACHNLGGAGGAGPVNKNVDIVTAIRNAGVQFQQQRATRTVPNPALPPPVILQQTLPQQVFQTIFGNLDAPPARTPSPPIATPQQAPATRVPDTRTPQPDLQTPVQQTQQPVPQQVVEPVPATPSQSLPPQIRQPAPQDPAEALADAKRRAEQLRKQREQDAKQLRALHPGFVFSPSVVLHKSATTPDYLAWRGRLSGMHFGQVQTIDSAVMTSALPVFQPGFLPQQQRANPQTQASVLLNQIRHQAQVNRLQTAQSSQTFQHGNFAITRSQRNTTALFGAGLIDAIPVALLEALEKKQSNPIQTDRRITGRVARLKDGSAGRFGWKGQTASLNEFVMTACAVEVGLNVPDHPQAGVPQKPDYQAPGLDLNQAECDALIQYIAELPAPVQQKPADSKAAEWVAKGHRLFRSVGCNQCHTEEVGEVAGIFSDLLLHDMGPLLGDTGSYGVFVPDSSPEQVPLGDLVNVPPGQSAAQRKIVGATRLEWRTPPLWGVRDSAPYMHDGRADTLEQAIALHGGEAEHITQAYFGLSAQERLQLVSFLKTLSAPPQQMAQLDK